MTESRGLDVRRAAGNAPGLIAALTEAGLPVDDLTEPGRRFFVGSVLGRPHDPQAGGLMHRLSFPDRWLRPRPSR
ncbi:hypothetical protein [Cereibacter johrii]|uniref:hypothetical protein n=1 Tax=Cereibacter johrii TaxID=445629 RepID=UPI003CED9D47